MMKSIKRWITGLIKFIDRHLIWALLAFGVISYLLGIIASHYSHTAPMADPLKSLAKIIIGAGVFTALTKSNYYTNFFQNRVFNVFYKPGEHFSPEQMKEKWLTLTEHLLSKKTGKSSSSIAGIIYNRFLSQDIEYYFKNMSITYDIILDEKTSILTITQNMESLIVITDGVEEITLPHKILTDGEMELKHLLIDDEPYDDSSCYQPHPENPNIRKLDVIIKNNNREAKIERCYISTQNIHDEPFILNGYSRYVNGLVVKFKTTNCYATFRTTGVTSNPENPLSCNLEGNGYSRVVIAKQEDLTLPGQGFILILSKLDKGV